MFKTITITVLFAASALAQWQSTQSYYATEDKRQAEHRADTVFFYSSDASSEAPIPNAPFSADQTTTTTQTLFDGNRIVNTSASRVYRDQQGRTRIERTLSNIGPLPAGQAVVNITIGDPVAGTHYTLDRDSKTAYKGSNGLAETSALQALKLATEAAVTKARTESHTYSYTVTASSSHTAHGQERAAKQEDLGTSNMAGVQVKGTRSTTVIPAGTMGNDRDINIVDERWYSAELKMNIMTKHLDPRSGETVFQVTNLTRANPDITLFQVPADYQIKDGPPKASAIRINVKE